MIGQARAKCGASSGGNTSSLVTVNFNNGEGGREETACQDACDCCWGRLLRERCLGVADFPLLHQSAST
jgi:hypothetical protein